MVSLTALWLPILVSAVIVFIASTIMHMGLPFWHTPEYKNVDDDRPFVEGTRSLRPGMYVFPRMDFKNMTAEQKAEWEKGPTGLMYVRNPAAISMGKNLTLFFLYCIVSGIFVAYIASETLAPGTDYRRVFQIAGATGTIFWAFGNNISDAIWYGKPWSTAIKYVVDGFVYGLLLGGTFGWLWPS